MLMQYVFLTDPVCIRIPYIELVRERVCDLAPRNNGQRIHCCWRS